MGKKSVSGWVDDDLAETVRDVAYWDRETISDLVNEALRKLVEERVRNRGQPYPRRPKPNKRGRPAES